MGCNVVEEQRVYYPLQVMIIDWFIMFVNQTQVQAVLRCLSLYHVTNSFIGKKLGISLNH